MGIPPWGIAAMAKCSCLPSSPTGPLPMGITQEFPLRQRAAFAAAARRGRRSPRRRRRQCRRPRHRTSAWTRQVGATWKSQVVTFIPPLSFARMAKCSTLKPSLTGPLPVGISQEFPLRMRAAFVAAARRGRSRVPRPHRRPRQCRHLQRHSQRRSLLLVRRRGPHQRELRRPRRSRRQRRRRSARRRQRRRRRLRPRPLRHRRQRNSPHLRPRRLPRRRPRRSPRRSPLRSPRRLRRRRPRRCRRWRHAASA
mmetsp:Transcript_77635/g.215081  ORF Transcript_77635/g.215081 Transcript_77635/m.215081 type:complete len:253 (-) Transcript_77635:390-1148(-)